MESQDLNYGCDDGNNTLSSKTEFKQTTKLFLYLVPIVLISGVAGFPFDQIADQIIYERLGGNISNADSSNNLCVATNGSRNSDQNEVQAQATIFKLYMAIGSCTGGIISMPFWSGWSDTIGRQVGFLAAFLGMFIKAFCFLLVVSIDQVPLWILIISDTIQGLLGKGAAMIFAGAASFIADITPSGKRTLFMLILEFLFLFSAAIGDLGTGFFIQQSGFGILLVVMMSCYFTGILYTMLVFEKAANGVKTSIKTSFSIVRYLTSTFRTFIRKRPERPYVRRLLFLLESMLFIYYCGFLGSYNIINVYTLGYPLCWGSVLIGINNAVMVASSGIFPLLFGFLFQKLGPTPILILIGLLCAMLGNVLMGLAVHTWMMLFGVTLFAIRALVSGTGRSILADLLDSSEIGAGMAGYGIVAIGADLVSSVAFNNIYAHTLYFCKGCVFFVGAGCFGTSCLFLCAFVFVRYHSSKESNKWKPLSEEYITN